MEVNENSITIVGCGPGSADYLMPVAQKAVAKAQVLVGAQRLLDLFPDSSAERIIVTAHIADVMDNIQQAAKDRSVVVLVSGDPGLFSLSKSVTSAFGRGRCRIIPAVSSVQVAFAMASLSWEDAKVISAHHKLPRVQEVNFDGFSKVAILAGHKDIKLWLAELMVNLKDEVSIFVCEDLTLESESVRNVSPDQLDEIEFGSRTVILIVKKEML
ncbi:MAG: precorrin-6y C5,15-methyltransferase (decarboxylating) subunit CbiE [Planctomycetes bacterium]|nr:precorrin-6y C5,15-methyltransferase (decarboxylating) subunit CbiE [Planctomycetota bacterium]